MGITSITTAGDLKDLLNTSWRNNNVKRPEIDLAINETETGLEKKDKIVIYTNTEGISPFSLYGTNWLHTLIYTIECVSHESHTTSEKLLDEIDRIIKANVRFSINNRNYVDMLPTNIVPLIDNERNIFRYHYEVQIRQVDP